MIDTKQRAKYILEEYANCYSQVDLEQLAKYLDEIKAEAYKEFAELVQGEIDDALHSNYNAKEERYENCKKHGIPIDAEDSFLMYCDGKIHALSGLQSFVSNTLKELVGDK